MRLSHLLATAALVLAAPVAALAADWSGVADALGKSGAETPDGVYRVGLPRTDLKVTLDGVELKPSLALGSWLAFARRGDAGEAVVMGDLVLTDNEVNPVMKRLVEGGIEITALHNHLLRNTPHTMYMHIAGHGDPAKLAATLHEALGQSRTPLGTATTSRRPPSRRLPIRPST